MSNMPPSFVKLIESDSEDVRELFKNVRPVTITREPEELSAETGDDLCWIWQGNVTSEGYARHSHELVHRRAYEILNGPIPENMRIERDCENRLCMNPRHLRLATRSQILLHASTGNKIRLTFEQREEIKKAIASGESQSAIALRFGISQGQVSLIKNNKTWKKDQQVPFIPGIPEQLSEAEERAALGLTAWLNLQMFRLGPVGQIARGEVMPDHAREKALSKATKEYMTYQLLSREYEARRKDNR